MLLVQKDYENRGFAPFYMRPIPLFALGFFTVKSNDQILLNKRYGSVCKLIDPTENVCEVDLKKIWEKTYENQMSFPKFKFMLYTKHVELDFNQKYSLIPAMSVEIFFEEDGDAHFSRVIDTVKSLVHASQYQGSYIQFEEIVSQVAEKCRFSKYRAENIVNVLLAGMDTFQRDYSARMNARMYTSRATQNGKVSYLFSNATREFFSWLTKRYSFIKDNTASEKLYVVNDKNRNHSKEITTVLGILESVGALRFNALGGSNSQIYIYVNETKNMQMVRDRPQSYKNQLLELINSRHQDSVQMLTFLFQSQFSSDEVWNHLENYFLGILPDELEAKTITQTLISEDTPAILHIGEDLRSDYSTWAGVNALFDNEIIASFDSEHVPLADYYASSLSLEADEIEAQLVWTQPRVAITSGEESDVLREHMTLSGWLCFPIDSVNVSTLKEALTR